MTRVLPEKRAGRRCRFEAEFSALGCAARGVGIEILAAHLGKSDSTLRSELVPSQGPDSPHKLGFDDALAIMYLSGDVTPLHRFLARLDCNIVPKRLEPQGIGRFTSALRLLEKGGEYASCLADVLADGKITDEEWVSLGKIVDHIETIAAIINAHRKSEGA